MPQDFTASIAPCQGGYRVSIKGQGDKVCGSFADAMAAAYSRLPLPTGTEGTGRPGGENGNGSRSQP